LRRHAAYFLFFAGPLQAFLFVPPLTSRAIENFINESKQEGFRFAIDDLCPRSSSFQYSKTVRIDFLRADDDSSAAW